MQIEDILLHSVADAIYNLYGKRFESGSIVLGKTNKEFEGDFTLVVFPFLKISKKPPEATARQIGEFLLSSTPEVEGFNVVKGFLNIIVSGKYWLGYFNKIAAIPDYAYTPVSESSATVMVEYSSPNTNKPLHLGHVRNNLLGYSVAEILKANGNKVIRTNLVNDRGIHICKSMLAWKKWGNGETPESTQDTASKKGDHLVGKYYVLFDKHLKEEVENKVKNNWEREEALQKSELMSEAQEMLNKWEKGDAEVVSLWEKMNAWVYKGFEETYTRLGVSFDRTYYESQTYLLGKKMVEAGLNKIDLNSGRAVFFKKEDGSVRIDLTKEGLDEKVLLRSDGTSVYMTQDLGTAVERFREFPNLSKLIYTVGNEQEYHFKVLFLILGKLGYKWSDDCYHLSYGMVELPEGKMKSREGTVVDADDLIRLMVDTAREMTLELGKTEGLDPLEADRLYTTIGLGALKYFILKVDPKKKMLFNPKESIDFNGNTGPFIQYTYARTRSILRKAVNGELEKYNLAGASVRDGNMDKKDRDLIRLLYDFPKVIREAAKEYNPGLIANYVYDLSKEYNQFYHDTPILKEENFGLRVFRLALSNKVAQVIKSGMLLLGIEVPEQM
jgi:arginyl-tRNA synthetase